VVVAAAHQFWTPDDALDLPRAMQHAATVVSFSELAETVADRCPRQPYRPDDKTTVNVSIRPKTTTARSLLEAASAGYRSDTQAFGTCCYLSLRKDIEFPR
jgi:hypothetical protein